MGRAVPLTLAGAAAVLWLVVAAAGLSLAVLHARLPVLGQAAAVATGAYLTGAAVPALPLPLAAVLAVGAAVLAGGLIGGARGDVGTATWAAGWALLALLAAAAGAGGELDASLPLPVQVSSPALRVTVTATSGVSLGLALAVAVAVLAGLRRVLTGPLGLELTLLGRDPVLAAALGIDVTARRRAAMAACCGLGALAGAGALTLQGIAGPTDVAPLLSVELLAAVLAGGARWWGPVAGVLLLELLLRVVDPSTAAAVLVLIGLGVPALRARRGGRRGPRAGAPAPVARALRPGARATVAAAGLTVRLGDRLLLDGVDLEVRGGEVHAVVGPNGAGKSTLLLALAGAVAATGSVRVDGRELGRAPTAARALAGLVRTPQDGAPLPDVAVGTQLLAAAAPGGGSARALRHLAGAPGGAAGSAGRAARVTAGLTVAGLPADVGPTLTTLELRLLQVARAVAAGARIVLLDEPAAGVAHVGGRDRVAAAIRALADSGIGVLLVEHDLTLVAGVADRATALVEGRVAATGSLAEVLAVPLVRDAYLGGPAPDPV